jgi:hypothetical protein
VLVEGDAAARATPGLTEMQNRMADRHPPGHDPRRIALIVVRSVIVTQVSHVAQTGHGYGTSANRFRPHRVLSQKGRVGLSWH